jgi:hypothetical protein
MRFSFSESICLAGLLTASLGGTGWAQDVIAPQSAPASLQASTAPVTLLAGTRVRLATVSGRIVCEAVVERADADSLIVDAWRRDRQAFSWQQVQYLWRGERRYRERGWTVLQTVGVIGAVVGTTVVLQKAKQSEGFAPLGYIFGVLPLVLLPSVMLVAFGDEIGHDKLAEFTEWQRLPVVPMASTSGLLPQHVPNVCD